MNILDKVKSLIARDKQKREKATERHALMPLHTRRRNHCGKCDRPFTKCHCTRGNSTRWLKRWKATSAESRQPTHRNDEDGSEFAYRHRRAMKAQRRAQRVALRPRSRV